MTKASQEETKKLLQVEFRAEIERIGSEQWLIVYSSHHDADGNGGYFCALVPSKKVAEVMMRATWELKIGDGLPGFSQKYVGKRPVATYNRFGADDGVEPLVFVRFFHGIKPDCIELAEEFRYFLNLYHDRHNDRYVRVDDNGGEEIVAEVTRERVRIKTRPLRQFLAARGMCLAVYFDSVAFSLADAESFEPKDRGQDVNRSDLRYSFYISDRSLSDGSSSRVLGKRLIMPLPVEECGIWPYEARTKPHIEFIIGIDKDGNEITHTCDPDTLANHFGRNPDAPHFIAPVVFRREVLGKYFDHPEKYEVSDGYLRCAGLWGLRIDNDSEDRVTVFLGDLGETLGHEEQLYWRSFNITPFGDGRDLSAANVKRSFDGEFADPSSPELVFKWKLTTFQEQWEKNFGWQLIRGLRDEDAHVFKKLRVPVTTSMAEFEDQLLGLTKLLVDSLNDSEIVKALGGALPDEKSIAKFERFLTTKNYSSMRRDIDLLRLLQEARSSAVAHRKGDSFKKVAQKLHLKNAPAPRVFSGLLQGAIDMIDGLTEFFLSSPASR